LICFFHLSIFAVEFTWGDAAKTNIDQKDIDIIIKQYVDTAYPHKSEEYQIALKEQQEDKLKKIQNITFINENLMWQDTSVNKELKLNGLELKVYCRKLNFAKRKDWRVPTFTEMISLVDYSISMPASLDKIKYINSSRYWTSTVSSLEKDKNWFIDFKYGNTETDSDLVRYNIRCVRDMSTKEGEY